MQNAVLEVKWVLGRGELSGTSMGVLEGGELAFPRGDSTLVPMSRFRDQSPTGVGGGVT